MNARRSGELAPSVIAADFSDLAGSLRSVEAFSRRWHVDVMDGHYVPNLTVGPMVVEAIASISALPQDVHLMIRNPESSWDWYAKAGAARIAFHPETASRPQDLLARLNDAGLGAGIAVNPDVDADAVMPLLERCDHIIVMTVNPGFSGQAFIESVMPKLQRLRAWVDEAGSSAQLIVDGGVNERTAPVCVEAGADVLVSASAVFGSPDPAGVASRLAGTWER